MVWLYLYHFTRAGGREVEERIIDVLVRDRLDHAADQQVGPHHPHVRLILIDLDAG
jgi:hypothetical protein